MSFRKQLTAFLVLALSAGFGAAQPQPGCGSFLRAEDLAAFQEAEARRLERPHVGKAATWYFIPIQFHIVRKSNGNDGLDPSDIGFILNQLNEDFAEMNMVFYSAAPIDYIDDDQFYDEIDSDAEIDDLRRVNNEDQWLDMYFVQELEDDAGLLCGISSFSTFGRTQGIVVKNDCTINDGDPSTVTHEVGHYFDLLHTHESANGLECVDGSNCSYAGDFVCDTWADPELGSHNVEDCTYVGNERDSCNNDLYSPRVHNFMSYSPHECRTQFTEGQVTRALSTLLSTRADHITASSSDGEAVYVDRRALGFEFGTSISPYDTLAEGITWAQATGRKLVIVAGGNYAQTFTSIGYLHDVSIVPTAGTDATFGQ